MLNLSNRPSKYQAIEHNYRSIELHHAIVAMIGTVGVYSIESIVIKRRASFVRWTTWAKRLL